MFLLYTTQVFYILWNKLYGNADDSSITIMLHYHHCVAVVPFIVERVALEESSNRDLNRLSKWCHLWRMKFNTSTTKAMIVSRSCTIHYQSTQ